MYGLPSLLALLALPGFGPGTDEASAAARPWRIPISGIVIFLRTGRVCARINRHGRVRNRRGITVGFIRTDGAVRDKRWRLRGFILRGGKIATARRRHYWRLLADGKLKDRRYRTIAIFRADGWVHNRRYRPVARVVPASKKTRLPVAAFLLLLRADLLKGR